MNGTSPYRSRANPRVLDFPQNESGWPGVSYWSALFAVGFVVATVVVLGLPSLFWAGPAALAFNLGVRLLGRPTLKAPKRLSIEEGRLVTTLTHGKVLTVPLDELAPELVDGFIRLTAPPPAGWWDPSAPKLFVKPLAKSELAALVDFLSRIVGYDIRDAHVSAGTLASQGRIEALRLPLRNISYRAALLLAVAFAIPIALSWGNGWVFLFVMILPPLFYVAHLTRASEVVVDQSTLTVRGPGGAQRFPLPESKLAWAGRTLTITHPSGGSCVLELRHFARGDFTRLLELLRDRYGFDPTRPALEARRLAATSDYRRSAKPPFVA